MLKSAVLIMWCIFLIKLYPKRNMVLNGFNKTRLYSDNKIWGTFTKQRIQCFVVGDGSYFTYGTFSFKSCITREITSLSTKKKDFLYTEKHGAFCDINFGWPIVHFKFWHQKGDAVFIFKDLHVFIIVHITFILHVFFFVLFYLWLYSDLVSDTMVK